MNVLACTNGEYRGRPPLPGTTGFDPLPLPGPRACLCTEIRFPGTMVTGLTRGALELKPSLLASGFASALVFDETGPSSSFVDPENFLCSAPISSAG